MSEDLSAGRAPIAYRTIRGDFQRARALVASLLCVTAIIFIVTGSGLFAIPYAIGSAVIAIDALYRQTHGTTATIPLLIDITVVGAMFALGGASPAAMAAAMAYGIVAVALLLPARQASILLAYVLVWAVVVVSTGGVGLIARSQEGHFDTIVAGLLLISIAALISGAARTLVLVQDRQRELLRQERRTVEVKNEFVSMVSHELRTPITGISGFAETLREHWRELPPAEVDEFLTILRGESDHLTNIVEDILVIPRLDSGHLRFHLEQINVAAVAETVTEMVFENTDTVQIDIPAYVTVWSDPARLRQILRNLMENADKYGGNEVYLSGEERREGTFTVIVADNGNGVAEADRERIFEHFEQLSSGDARLEQGVGLGLPIARKLARAMGGDLWYEDRFPVGAQFCFDVDLVKEMAPSPKPVPAEAVFDR